MSERATALPASTAKQFVEALMALPESQRSGRFSVRVNFAGRLQTKAVITMPAYPSEHPTVISGSHPRLGVRDLITGGSTTAAGVQYIRETAFTNNAAVVAPGAVKPETTATYETKTANVATIAHWTKISAQLMDDAPALESQLETRLLFFLGVAEDKELLTGTGAGHTDGLLPLAVATTGVTGVITPANLPDALGKAIVEVGAAGYVVNGIVLNPADWAAIVQLRGTGNGPYLVTQPGAVNPQMTLWGYPVVPTPAMTVGQFLVGDFASGAQVFDRADASVMISNQNVDDFVKNLLTVLAEERLAQAVYQPAAFRKAG